MKRANAEDNNLPYANI